MTLLHFEPALGTAKPAVTASAVTLTDEVAVIARPSESKSFVARAEGEWTWSDLRDYVVTQIEQRFGTFPRDFKKEAGIFKSFLTRHGAAAGPIARLAFEIEDGYWAGAPISINRWCKNSDPFFADVLSARLVTAPVAGW